MRIEHFGGDIEATDIAMMESALHARYGDDANEFLLSHTGNPACLTIMVRGTKATLCYFPSDGHPGYVPLNAPRSDETEIFFTNTPFEEIEVSADAVVSVGQAFAAARSFFHDPGLPHDITWFEL